MYEFATFLAQRSPSCLPNHLRQPGYSSAENRTPGNLTDSLPKHMQSTSGIMSDMRVSDRLKNLDKWFAPYYWLAAVLGTLCFLANVTLSTGGTRLIAVVWVILVPLWIRRYVQYRKAQRRR